MRTSSTAKLYESGAGENLTGNIYAAVIAQAVDDAVFGTSTSSDAAQMADWEQAVSFCTMQRGEWRESRETLCEAVGIDPDIIRNHVLAILRGEKEPTNYEMNASRLQRLAKRRALWVERCKSPEPVVQRARAVHAKQTDGVWVGNQTTTHINNVPIIRKRCHLQRLIHLFLIGTPRAEIDAVPRAKTNLHIVQSRYDAHLAVRGDLTYLAPNNVLST